MIQIWPREATGKQGADEEAMPHVLLVLDQIPRTLGGGERIVLRLASLLPRYGFRASILTFAIHPESAPLHPAPCPFFLLPLQRTYGFHALRAALDLRRFLREQNISVVQTFFESSDLWAGGVAKATSDAKLVWSRRDMGILRARKHRIAYRLLADLPDAVFAVSEEVRRYCIDVDKIDPSRVVTVYNGLDLGQWSASRPAGDRETAIITTVGNIRRVKGHDVLIRAAGHVVQRFPKTKFQIAGAVLEPEYYRELQELVGELNLGEQVEFLGGLSDPKGHLAQADIFVLPSRSEGFSNAIVEAMAAGLPVVATSVGGNAEAVENGKTGWIVPSEDATALADAICRLLAAPAEAGAMGAAGRARAAELFTTEGMMRRIVETYTKLLA